jgi:hypothetical protein
MGAGVNLKWLGKCGQRTKRVAGGRDLPAVRRIVRVVFGGVGHVFLVNRLIGYLVNLLTISISTTCEFLAGPIQAGRKKVRET